jgi:fatty-acyl-CoA synthase
MTSEWNFGTIFAAIARTIPDSPAIDDGPRRLTWAQFQARSAALGCDLLAAGLAPQARVAVYLRNCAEFLESYQATLLARLVPVNVNYRYEVDELVYLLDDADTDAVIVHADFADKILAITARLPRVRRYYVVGGVPLSLAELAELAEAGVVVDYEQAVAAHLGESPDAAAGPRTGQDMLFVYTGGTTGMPKGVMWRQGDLFDALVPTSKDTFGIPTMSTVDDLVRTLSQPGPRGLSASPLMHGTGLFHQFVILMSGGTAVIYDNRSFDPRRLWQTVAEKRVTAMVIVGDAFGGPLLEVLDAEPGRYDLSALQVISSSGAIWSRATKIGLLRHLPRITLWDALAAGEGFGVGKSLMTAADADEDTGVFTLGDHVRVRGADGTFLPRGVPGEGAVVVTGALPMGYHKDPAKTATTFVTDGALRYSVPGDMVEVLEDGRARFLGRGSACINTGGEKVYVEEVEQVVHNHPSVADVACVGVPDDRFGAVVCAVVRLHDGAALTREELTDFVKARLASYKAPRRLVLVEDVPRTAQGKPDYPALRDLAAVRLALT